MLVAAIMDIVTSNCDNVDKIKLKPMLSGTAAMRDIAAALEVIEEGGMHMDEPPGSSQDDDDGTGLKGIGMEVLGGTSIVGLSTSNRSMELDESKATHNSSSFNKLNNTSSVNTTVIPGLWDDLHSQHVAVPFAAWALANWAMASDVNRSHMQELDFNGHAVMSALIAPERSVKFHGSLVAQLLLKDENLPMNDFVSDWSSTLLTTVSQASKADDISLTRVALSAFLLSLERCPGAQRVVMEKGLHLMRETAKRTMNHKSVQESLAKGLYHCYFFFSFLFMVIYGNTLLLQTQIDQANVLSGTQSVNQLASAVVNLVVNGDSFALEDFLTLEPFINTYKNLKKGNIPKVNALDSALATLKGIKAMTEICSDDLFSQKKIIDYGIIPLLRRFLLSDDYEKLSAIEAYDAQVISFVLQTSLTQWSGSSLPLQHGGIGCETDATSSKCRKQRQSCQKQCWCGMFDLITYHYFQLIFIIIYYYLKLQDMSIGTSWNN
uniref:Uncharacterized protein n=1 Tax=Lactuca sativa TaxID=4236 RepID=A0A9R1UJJ3_LACSA|nr:hypothetical protein LSAT_V11C900460980 [Lactuca sativa]